jgi:hypothetical protein
MNKQLRDGRAESPQPNGLPSYDVSSASRSPGSDAFEFFRSAIPFSVTGQRIARIWLS